MSDLINEINALRQDLQQGLIDFETYKILMKELAQQQVHSYDVGDVGDDSSVALGTDAIALSNGSVLTQVQGDAYFGVSETGSKKEALKVYRKVLMNECSEMLLGVSEKSATNIHDHARPLSMSSVYVALNTTKMQRINRQSVLTRVPITALKACSSHSHIVLLAEPGGGKSTFINYLCYSLCSYQLGFSGDITKRITNPRSGLRPENLNLIPIKIILRDFASTLSKEMRQPPLIALVVFIQDQLKSQSLGFVFKHLQNTMNQGNTWLMFDGLDEVTDKKQCLYIRNAVEAFRQRFPQCHMLVTCRTLSYHSSQMKLDLHRFVHFELAQLDTTHQEIFISEWYLEFVRQNRLKQEVAMSLANKLKREIKRDDLNILSGNPLLLTIIAMVHTLDRRLPEGRAQLYEKTVNMLLWRWEEIKSGDENVSALRQLLDQANRTDFEFLNILAKIAFFIHSEDSSGNEIANINRQQIYEALKPLSPDHGWAQKVVETMQQRAGLLVERQPEIFSFPHRTFQEYLAGVHIANSHDNSGRPNFPEIAAKLSHLPQWRIVILLAIGYLAYVKPEPYRILALFEELCPQRDLECKNDWLNLLLLGAGISEMGIQRMADTEQGRTLLARSKQRMVKLLKNDVLTPRERMEGGRILANIGDPRPYIVNVDEMPLCLISAGQCWLGNDDSKNGVWYDGLSEVYWLSKYPITVGQFNLFVQDWHYKPDSRLSLIGADNQPANFVSWHDACMFCEWLDQRWRQEKWMPKGYRVALPSESEWEKGARGGVMIFPSPKYVKPVHMSTCLREKSIQESNESPDRKYPWGNQPEQVINKKGGIIYRANCEAAHAESLTSVGTFPLGCSPFGCSDMSGQVWEWTRTMYHWSNPIQPDKKNNRMDRANRDMMILRGGSRHKNHNLCSSRLKISASEYFNDNYGFRICITNMD